MLFFVFLLSSNSNAEGFQFFSPAKPGAPEGGIYECDAKGEGPGVETMCEVDNPVIKFDDGNVAA